MYEITCLDSDGNSISHFTQWDVDQKITIVLYGCPEDFLSIAPQIHFSNSHSKEALVVRSEVYGNDTIVAPVPNVLLQEPYPLFVHVYLTDSENVSSQKVILTTEIPIRKRVKPSDYSYVENIERITAQQIKKEIKKEIVNEINESDISFKDITLLDVITQQPYTLYFTEGKFTMDQADNGKVPYRSVTFSDEVEEAKYKIFVSDGKLKMDVVY